jgi:pilus assembly protein FimV
VLNLDAEAMEALSEGTAAAPKASTPAQASSQASDELSLDLTPPHQESTRAPAGATVSTDRLGATLALAEQFLEIGEKEGARALLEEVIAGESDLLRERAKTLLTKAG